MSESFEKFPPTAAGKKMAMAFADAEGCVWWEEYVDWNAEKDYRYGEFDERQVLLAVRQAAIEQSDLFSSQQISQVNETLHEFGLEGVLGTCVPYAGTETDIPRFVRPTDPNPHPESRQSLPA